MGARRTAVRAISLLQRFPFERARYACYPTPAHFSAAFGAPQARAAMSRRRSAPTRPIALAVCLPASPGDAAALLESISGEAALLGSEGGLARAQALGIHGADEAVLDSRAFATLLRTLGARFQVGSAAGLAELDAACATPRTLSRLAELGFGRVRLRCRSDAEEGSLGSALQAAQTALAVPIDASIEHGRAGQVPEAVADAVAQAARSGATCIILTAHAAPPELDRARRAATLAAALDSLAATQYVNAGLDVFARPSREAGGPFHSRFDVIGLGPGAISSCDDWYAQNEEDPARYARAVGAGRLPVARGHCLSADDRLRREVIHGLECLGAVGFSWIEHKHRIEFARYFRAELEQLEAMHEEGLVELYQDAIEVPAEARPMTRLVSAVFDRYLAGRAPAMKARST